MRSTCSRLERLRSSLSAAENELGNLRLGIMFPGELKEPMSMEPILDSIGIARRRAQDAVVELDGTIRSYCR